MKRREIETHQQHISVDICREEIDHNSLFHSLFYVLFCQSLAEALELVAIY